MSGGSLCRILVQVNIRYPMPGAQNSRVSLRDKGYGASLFSMCRYVFLHVLALLARLDHTLYHKRRMFLFSTCTWLVAEIIGALSRRALLNPELLHLRERSRQRHGCMDRPTWTAPWCMCRLAEHARAPTTHDPTGYGLSRSSGRTVKGSSHQTFLAHGPRRLSVSAA